MHTIGIIGASGQVGTELCLFLGLFPEVRLIAVCRSVPSAAFLRRCGVECRIGDLTSIEDARRLLEDCDLVFDLSLPKGLVFEIRAATDRTIRNAVHGSPNGAKFVFASTEMAFGHRMAPGVIPRQHLFAQTSYGANKRAAERTAFREGRRAGRSVWSLRLGQVHGEMQSISRGILGALDARPTYAPEVPSNTVFIFSIAEALVGIAEGRERTGVYTLVSTPQWSWRKMHEYYAERLGVRPSILSGAGTRVGRATGARGVRRWLEKRVFAMLASRRDYLNGYLLYRFPSLEWSAKATWLRKSAASQITRGMGAEASGLYAFSFEGETPGARLSTLSDSRTTMEPFAEKVRAILHGAVPPPQI